MKNSFEFQEYPNPINKEFNIHCENVDEHPLKQSASTAESTYRSARKHLTVARRLQISEVKSLSKEPVKFRMNTYRSTTNLKQLNESALKSFDIYSKASYPIKTAV